MSIDELRNFIKIEKFACVEATSSKTEVVKFFFTITNESNKFLGVAYDMYNQSGVLEFKDMHDEKCGKTTIEEILTGVLTSSLFNHQYASIRYYDGTRSVG